MYKFVISVLALIAISVNVYAKELDRVFAIVNEQVITKSEYDQELLNTTLELKAQGRQLPDASILQRQILDRMISDRLQLQLARNAGIQVSPAQVQSAIQTIAQRNNLDVATLKTALESDGIDYTSFANRIENQLLIQQVIERQINSKVNISDQEIEEFLQSNGDDEAGLSSEFNISHVVVPVTSNDNAGYDEARKKIDKAYQSLQDGNEFVSVVSQYSDYEDAIEGGNLGWRKSGELPGIYSQAIRVLGEGEFSEVLQSESAFHIIKLNQIRTGSSASDQQITQLRLRQIFIEFDRNSTPEFMRLKMNEIGQRLNAGEDFSTLAQIYSEDAASRIKGGDMGWVGPGDYSAVIENVIYNLGVGQISQPVQFGNGVSIFEVTEKRQQHAGDLFEKNAAREQLHVRKAEKMYQDWLQELRDRAYVQLMMDDLN